MLAIERTLHLKCFITCIKLLIEFKLFKSVSLAKSRNFFLLSISADNYHQGEFVCVDVHFLDNGVVTDPIENDYGESNPL